MLLKLSPPVSPSQPESGFTIIESLLAIVVVAILLVGVGPLVVFSAATRVQARRVEVGLQSARGFVSGVNSQTIDDPPIEQSASTNEPIALLLKGVDAPNITLNCPTANDYCGGDTTQWAIYCVDQDGDAKCTSSSPKDLIIQAFGIQAGDNTAPRNFKATDASDASVRPDAGYQLGIRVYRANAFVPEVDLKSSKDSGSRTQASTVTSGMGSRAFPLVELSTAVNTSQTDFEAYCQRINTGANQGQCNL